MAVGHDAEANARGMAQFHHASAGETFHGLRAPACPNLIGGIGLDEQTQLVGVGAALGASSPRGWVAAFRHAQGRCSRATAGLPAPRPALRRQFEYIVQDEFDPRLVNGRVAGVFPFLEGQSHLTQQFALVVGLFQTVETPA